MDAERARKILREQLAAATEEARAASLKFDMATWQPSSGLPHPDGIRNIKTASKDYAVAREKVTLAMRRLNDLILHGRIPEDL